jgi:hypothetical protein
LCVPPAVRTAAGFGTTPGPVNSLISESWGADDEVLVNRRPGQNWGGRGNWELAGIT